MKREQLVTGLSDSRSITLRETSDSDGRFRIEDVIPGSRFHLIAIPTRVNPIDKTIAQTEILSRQVLDLGDLQIDRNATMR